ncbi:hypothetical protein L6452_27869 [Arctium lappa]|uniref:Uncharacterized protein n=1 Tax=Arctium lappa TaxID=4217 RepID=A0ACB8ZX62_ARCLA|nr:hypothetical protein L6452_27869 [Arctium lappa]
MDTFVCLLAVSLLLTDRAALLTFKAVLHEPYLGTNLRDNKIIGRIPRSMVDLSSLKHLDLRNNMIYGTIPRNIGKLQMLSRALLSVKLGLKTLSSKKEKSEHSFFVVKKET